PPPPPRRKGWAMVLAGQAARWSGLGPSSHGPGVLVRWRRAGAGPAIASPTATTQRPTRARCEVAPVDGPGRRTGNGTVRADAPATSFRAKGGTLAVQVGDMVGDGGSLNLDHVGHVGRSFWVCVWSFMGSMVI
ncbi:MAG: hypothetical protein QOF49_1197, partial [Chloroflexota bacterium]|nr:hypothetical protein [Chloroflexota bacterium]